MLQLMLLLLWLLWWGLIVNVFKYVIGKKSKRFCENKKNGAEKIVS